MNILVNYFASLKEVAGKAEELVQTNCKTPLELYLELKSKHHFVLKDNEIRVAINHRFQTMDYKLCESDLVVFIPPVAGG